MKNFKKVLLFSVVILFSLGIALPINLVEAAYIPEIYNISVATRSDGVTITWITNTPTDSTVYFKDGVTNVELYKTDNSMITNHSLSISGLTPSRDYKYHIVARDAYGNSIFASSTEQIFTTKSVTTTVPEISNKVDIDCNKKNFTAALIFVTKKNSDPKLSVYKEKLDYIKNRFPWAFNFATGGLATISISENPVILDIVGLFNSDGKLDIQNTMKEFYKSNGDNFNFVYIFTDYDNTSGSYYHVQVKNMVKGIGFTDVFDFSSNYGSGGKLMGINYMNDQLDQEQISGCYNEQKDNFNLLTYNSNCGMYLLLHETAHQWASYAGDKVTNYNPSLVNLGILSSNGAHYYLGLNSPNGTRDPLADTLPWVKAPDNSLYLDNSQGSDLLKYHPFTLYFMGLLPENQYDAKFDILQNFGFSTKYGHQSMGSVYKQVSVRDIISKEGLRVCSSNHFSNTSITLPDILGTSTAPLVTVFSPAELNLMQDLVAEQANQIKYLNNLVRGTNISTDAQNTLNNFITYGSDDNTKKLGAGERAAVIASYKSAFDKLPTTQTELTDVVKIANGRWPSITSAKAESQAKIQFKKIYKREANMSNANDNAAVTIMAYGLRQKAENRNLVSEAKGIQTFKAIYSHTPNTTAEWNVMQAITYSGASR